MLNTLLRYLFYWPIRLTASCNPIPFEPLKQLKIDPDKPIAYVTVSSSIANLLTIERLTESLNLPSPFTPLILNGRKFKRIAYLRTPAFWSSRARKRDITAIFKGWVDAAAAQHTDIQIIPFTVLWSRNPSYEGIAIRGIDAPNPSWRKFFTLMLDGRDNCTIVSNPISITKLKQDLETKRPELLTRALSLLFLKTARSVVGQPFPNRELLIEELLQRTGTIEAIRRELVENPDLSYPEAKAKARQIFKVMVADTRYPLLRFLNCVISLLWKRFYHDQTIIGAARVRELVQSGHEIIYIPCHRSHMDYILLSFVIFHEGLPMPQIASGDNLNFFPVGPIIRRCGSYFIRRVMRGDKFYTAMFREYLSLLFERGYATEFFIEGGRSRTGRTLPPRTGMVSMTVQAQLRGIERPIAFIPTYLGYEHVMEVGDYMRELRGRRKVKENAWQLLGIFKRLRYYGRGYVTFGEPIIVPRFLSRQVPDWRKDIDPAGDARPAWLHDTVNALSHEIIIKLNASAVVNGINLCALAIINDSDQTLSVNMLRRCLNMYLTLLRCDSELRPLAPDAPIDTLIHQAFELRKFHFYNVGDDMKFVRPSRGQTLQLTYFRNNIIHLFALPALIATILIRNGHISREEVVTHTRSLFYFLKHELFAPVTEERLDDLIHLYLNVFNLGGYTTEDQGIIYLSGDGFEELLNLSRSIRLNLIRYLVAVTALKQSADNSITVPEFIDRCIAIAASLPAEIYNSSPEFADPIVFKIMNETFLRHHYYYLDAEDKLHKNEAKIDKLVRATAPLLGVREVKILQEHTHDLTLHPKA